MDIKSVRIFQGRGIGGIYKIRLNTDGRNRTGPHDCRYKTSITGFSGFQNCMYVKATCNFRFKKYFGLSDDICSNLKF